MIARKPSFLKVILVILLIMSPLAYAKDGDPFRPYEVLALMGFSSFVILSSASSRIANTFELRLVALLCIWYVVQQFFIPAGNPLFGIQYSLVMIAMFVPIIAIRNLPLNAVAFSRAAKFAITALSVTTIFSIFLSYFFGVGEVYSEYGGTRAFGWLGDSFTPIILFLIIFNFLEKNPIRTVALLAALVMTGGKTGILVLILSPLVYLLIVRADPSKWLWTIIGFALIGGLAWNYFDALNEVYLTNIDYSFYNRSIGNSIGVDYFAGSPVFGVGVNQSSERISSDSENLIYALGVNSYQIFMISNTFIRTAAETGIVGLALLLLLCYRWVSRSVRTLRAASGLESSAVRSLAIASALWVICFIVLYQSTGWFLYGHPQLAWLLVIVGLSEVMNRLPSEFKPSLRRNGFRRSAVRI